MNQGFIRVAAATPKIKVADCRYNSQIICKMIEEAGKKMCIRDSPGPDAGIAWHPQIPSWRNRHTSYFWSIR